ncbi:MAG: PQQ-binding-like beta-propeller repeat protein [Thermoguttaceae bacterium]
MRHAMRLIGVLASGSVLISTAAAFGQDWPQWRGPNRDGKASGFTAPETWPKALTQKWKTTVGVGDATPALVGDKLYVFTRQGDDEVLLCLNAADGKELWQNKYAAKAVSGPSAGQHSGPRSTPVVADGKVVTLGATGVVSCVDADSNKLVWRKNEFPGKWPTFYTSMSPLVVDGMAILQLGGGSDGTFVAYDLASGEQKWKWAGDGATYASPELMTVDGTKLIVGQTDKRMVALGAADGKLLWQVPFAPKGRMGYNAVTPIVDGQTLIYSGQDRGIKAMKFEKKGDGVEATQVWSNPDLGSKFSTPVLKDGLIFGLSDKGKFFCIDAKTGKTAWTDTASHGQYGAIVDAGSTILALTEKPELSVFQATDKAYTEAAQIKVSDTKTYAYPILSGKRVFVKDKDSLTMWAVE